MGKIWLIVLSIFMLSSLKTGAQKLWSLEDCIEYGLENSLSIQQAEVAEDYTDIALRSAQHARIPSLSASSSLTYSLGRSIDPTSNDFVSESFLSNGVSLSSGVMLFNGLRINNSIRKSKLDKRAAEEDTKQWKRDIAMNIATYYMTILFASENLENGKLQLKSTQDQLDKINKLVEAGALPVSDRYDMEAQLALDEQNMVRLENDLRKAYLDLKNMIRYEEDQDFRIAIPTVDGLELTDPDQWQLEELYLASLTYQPTVAAGELRLQSAQIDKKIAQASYYPTLGLGGSLSTNYSDKAVEVEDFTTVINTETVYLDNNPVDIGFEVQVPNFVDVPYLQQLKNNFGFGAGLQLNIPIYSNYQNKANVARSRLNIKSVEISNEQEKQRLKSSIQQALANARSAKKQLAASRKSAEALEVAFENAKKRFDLGQLNSYDFLNVKDRYDNAKTTLLIARYDFIFSLKVIDFYVGKPLNF
jgi:outer membrane protein